ncbi:MAG: hypothetical protein QXX13_09770 [Candidatus Methanomethylicia archaeon]
MLQIKVEILSIFPTFYSICRNCQPLLPASGLFIANNVLKDYPNDMKESYRKICDLALSLVNYFGDKIRISATDVFTPKGLWKSLRYRVKQYPVFIINGKHKIVGIPSFEEIKTIIMNELNS